MTSYEQKYSELLVKTEETVQKLKKDAEILNQGKNAIWCAGNAARRFYNMIKDYVKIECFIDNNEKLKGTEIEGLPCLYGGDFKGEYNLIIASCYDNYSEIIKKNKGFYYGEIAVPYLWDKYKEVLSLLVDDESKYCFLAAVYDDMTGDNTYVEPYSEQYFAIKEFNQRAFWNKIVVDCGAYVGDTVEEFMKYCPKKIYAFEPFPETYNALLKRTERLNAEWALPKDTIIPVNAGVSNVNEVKRFTITDNMLLTDSGGDIELQTYRLDDYFQNKDDIPYLIKADIEGDELEMLYGATEIIKEHKPKLVLALYHYFEDFYKLPLYLSKIVPEYKFAVRNCTDVYDDTVLFAYI
jgi:FkbM family methyltransferase